MARMKLKLAMIPNESARKKTFYKRKKMMLKKLGELSTLCGVNACAVIYSPYEQQPDVWPSPLDAKRELNMFKMMPQYEQCRKKLSHEQFLLQRITKIEDQLRKVQKENRREEMKMLMSECLKGNKDLHDLSVLDLTVLTKVIDEERKAIGERIEALKQIPPDIGTASSMASQKVAMNALKGQPWSMDHLNLNEPIPCFDNDRSCDTICGQSCMD